MIAKSVVILCVLQSIRGFVIPEELPSILSLIYSNIPPIKKGTDSRLGVGFRLGEHADFQVMVELGPQTNTKPIGVGSGITSKRNAAYNNKVMNSDGGKWLSNWSQQMTKNQASDDGYDNSKIVLNVPSDVATVQNEQQQSYQQPFIEDGAKRQLEMLYGTVPEQKVDPKNAQSENINTEIHSDAENETFPEVKTIKEKEKITAELSDVDLD